MSIKPMIISLILILIISCSIEKVKLEFVLDKEKDNYVYYEQGADNLYSGKYVSKGENDIVTIDFNNGKIDGDFLRLNNRGDTTEYIKYKNGRTLFQIDYLYEDGKLTWRNEIKDVEGTEEDEKVLNEVVSLITANDFYALDDFLNPLFRGQYKNEFNNLSNQFGRLKNIEITEIRKQTNPYLNREDIRAKMILNYEEIQLHSSFLIVKEKDGRLKGQAFTRRPISVELLPDNKID